MFLIFIYVLMIYPEPGGERGIRTPDSGFSRNNRFRGGRFRPLSHLSKFGVNIYSVIDLPFF